MATTRIAEDGFPDRNAAAPQGDARKPEGRGILERLVGVLQRPPWAACHAVFACIVAAVAAACFYTGVVPTRQYASDLTSFADCGWRVLNGLRPHVDFATGMGSFVFMMWAAALKLGGGTVNGLGYIQALVGSVVGIWAYFVLIRRVSGILAVAGSLMILFLAVAPTAPGESFRLSTHAMQYNRWGFAILAVVIAECLPLRFEGTERGFGGGVSSGVLLGVLLFLKPNYGGAALVICAASMLWNGRSEGRRMLGLLAGASAAVLPFLFFIHFQLGKWIADLRMSADARSGAVPIGWAGEVFTSNLPGILIVAGLAILSQFSAPTGIRTGWVGGLLRSRSVLLVAVVYVFGCALMLTNSQQERLPLNETLAVLFLDSILRGKLRLDARHAVAITLVVAGLVAGWTSSDVLAVMNGVRLRHAMGSQPPHPLAHRVDVGGFAPLWLMDDYNQDTGMVNHGAFVTAYLSDGAALLQRERKTGEIVATFDDYNALAYAVGARPARGGLAFAWYKYHFSDRLHPDPETFFGDADLVMYPKTPDLTAGGFAGLLKYYGATLERQFAPVAESERWKLYRKRPAAVVGAAR